MTRFAIIEEDAATDPKVLAVYDNIRRELGFGMVPNLFKSMATNPDFLEANWLKFRAIVLHGKLPRTLKEMIGIVISNYPFLHTIPCVFLIACLIGPLIS